MKRLGIHLRLLLTASLLIAAATFTLGGVGIHMTRQFMHQRFEERIAFLAKYLALNSEVGVLINDRAGLRSLALNLLGEKDVARVHILDNHNNSLVDLSRKVPRPHAMVETPVIFKKTKDENILFESGGYSSNSPFEQSPPALENHIGKVRIHFSTHGIDLLLNSITRRFMWASIALVVMAAFTFYLVSRSIGAELKQLSHTAQQIGRGDVELRARPGKLPETRTLALSFNAMLDSLNTSQENLAKVNRAMMKQKALAEMGKFSLMVAHEVKNPLAIIKSSLDMLKADLNLTSDETMVAYIEDEIRRLNQLIESFLQFAKPAKPTLREVDLNRMLGDTVERFQIMNENVSISMHLLPADRQVHSLVDRDLMIQAFGNIIKNAIESAGDDACITIRSEVDEGLAVWRVTIGDNGPGIDPAVKSQIFEPFFTTRSKGSGLGLPFSAQVCKSHGGYIMADNTPPSGAVFTVEIPLRRDDGENADTGLFTKPSNEETNHGSHPGRGR
ncbi:MAG: two-component sensor histidine kinase [Deltaproteobacteria bacterium]|nr:MAG: two-component sensor histidine kinase [Deltaproteobacteria bacterium]